MSVPDQNTDSQVLGHGYSITTTRAPLYSLPILTVSIVATYLWRLMLEESKYIDTCHYENHAIHSATKRLLRIRGM